MLPRLFLLIILSYSHYGFCKTLSAQIDDLIQTKLQNINLGIKIRNLNDDKIIYEKNSNNSFVFSSASKLFITSTIYNEFGLYHNFNATFSLHNNDLYLDITDHPSFSIKDLEHMVIRLTKANITKIRNIYIVDKPFSLPEQHPNKMFSDSMYCYGSKITSSHINKNCYHLEAKASEKLGRPAWVKSKYDVYNIKNNTKTISNDIHARITRFIDKNNIIVNGTLNSNYGKIHISPVIDDHISNISIFLKHMMNKHNIKYSGNISTTQKQRGKIISIASITNADIISKILKQSDNFVSDYMLASFARNDNFAEWNFAAKKMLNYISKNFNIDLKEAKLDEASGLSRLNLLTPNHFDSLLSALHKSQNFSNLMPLFCTPKEAGLLEKRAKNLNIYAKTGSMTALSSIVGYLISDNKTPYSFVIVTNNFPVKMQYIKDIEEEILKILQSH